MSQDSIVFDEPLNHAAEGSLSSWDRPPSVRPPTITSPTEFPFHDLAWEKFERLCQDIALVHRFTNVHRYGIRGQAQDGVDFTGDSPEKVQTAFQVKQTEKLTARELEAAVQDYAEGTVASRTDAFIVCMSIEANERELQDKLAALNEGCPFPITLWDAVQLTHLLRGQEDLVRKFFGAYWAEVYFSTSSRHSRHQDTKVLLIGPVQALGLTAEVEEADRLAQTSPAKAAEVYGMVADELRERFPGYADRFDWLRANSLKDAGNPAASHDALMKLAIRNLIERAEPSPGVTPALGNLHDDVDETRQARAAAVHSFGQWHERPQALKDLAQWFDILGPDDKYAPVIAVLMAEAAVADCKFEIVLERVGNLRRASENGDKKTKLRVNLAMADADVEGYRNELIDQAEMLQLPVQERAYVLLRAARWSAWEGELEQAEKWYRMAMWFGAEADLDLGVEKALWSLTALYSIETIKHLDDLDERVETNQLALTIQGSRSYVRTNPRTRERSYQHLANEQWPDAHLWTRFRLLESIRSGSFADELEARGLLARLYGKSNEPLAALEQGLLGGANKQVKDLSSRLDVWPDFLTDMVSSPVSWVRTATLTALERLGDLAPVQVARRLAHTLVAQLQEDTDNMWIAPATFQALQSVVLEATEGDLEQLVPVLKRAAPRKINTYHLTDPGVRTVAARLYRFRPAFRSEAASVLAEMAVEGSSDLVPTLRECGENLDELVAAFECVAQREERDFASPLSDLGHLNAATRELWCQRLQRVEQYPLDERSKYGIGSRYDISKQFLEEQEGEVVNRYVRKLVAIGRNYHEPNMNRANALKSASTAVELLSTYQKRELFGIVKPLIDPETKVSEIDRHYASTLHPLSRSRFSFGDVADIRAAALLVLAQSATEPDDLSDVVELALLWLGAEPEVLQRTGAAVLTLPHLSSPNVRSADLANHPNPGVRQSAVALSSVQKRPDLEILEHLASDSNKMVRIRVVYALGQIRDAAPEAYERIGSRLRDDRSAVVRALTAEVLTSQADRGSNNKNK